MYLVYLGITLLVIWFNLAGLATALSRWIPHYPIAKAAGLLGIWLVMFCIEHIQGLGQLYLLWPLTTALAAWVLYQRRHKARDLLIAELPFTVAFLYVFAWRFGFPDIYPSSERITDLFFISNYLGGDTLPPVDRWFPPYAFDYYYSLQFYGAALFARLLNLDGGTAYQLAYSLLFALSASLMWWVAQQLLPKRVPRWVLVIAVAAGGTGMSIFMPWLIENPEPDNAQKTTLHDTRMMWAGTRFIGSSDADINTPIGQWLFPAKVDAEGKPMKELELPLENFGYMGFLGDYHPPLSSFLLLFLALACIVWLEREPHNRIPLGILTGSVPVLLVANAWLFPLQALLVGCWVVYRWIRRIPLDYTVLIGGGLLSLIVLLPFLSHFTAQALSTPIRFVPWDYHTPWNKFLGLHWPLLILLVVIVSDRSQPPLARFFAVTFFLLYLLSEFIYVDDGTAGHFKRTNTSMKWWGWLFSGTALMWGVFALQAKARWRQVLAMIALLVLAGYLVLQVKHWVVNPKHSLGKLHGHHWITRDVTEKALLEYLQAQPHAIVLESKIKDAYNRNPLLTLVSGHTAFLGWVHHLTAWGRPAGPVMARSAAVEAFYKGTQEDALNWLLTHNIEHVVWNAEDNRRAAEAWQVIHEQINQQYYWHEFYRSSDTYRVGIWSRLPVQAPMP